MKLTYLSSALLLFIFTSLLPLTASAAGSATIAGLLSDTVAVGSQVSFTVVPSGFVSPTYKVVDSFAGSVNNNNIDGYGTVNWTPNNSELGDHTITITITDSEGTSATAAQTIHVVAPSVTITNVTPGGTVKFGNSITFGLSSTGFMGVQYSIADSFRNSTVSSANTDTYGNFHWTPLYQDIGTHTLVATARDYQGHSATASQQIVVSGPVGLSLGPVSPATTVHSGDSVSFSATTTGFTSPTYTVTDAFTSTVGTSSLAIDANGIVTWTPNANDIGSHLLTISASDSSGNSGTIQTLITVIAKSVTPSAPVVAATTTLTSTSTSPKTVASGPAYIFTTFMTIGTSGKDVMALQILLGKLGYLSAAPTGYFGAMTKAALQKFQTANNIAAVGYAGPATRVALSFGKY
jgi:peptidoglycan hydrolase-like protein with peptidoglycan-binding domain